MGKVVTLHSYKGGTGKTLFAINLAATFAKQGKKVCLFDLDFRAPSIFSLLKLSKPEFWLNDYLNNSCEIDKVIIDASSRISGNGKFFIGPACPETEAIRAMSSKNRKWEMRALGKLLHLRHTLLNEKGFDYLIFDSSPGLQYSSINAIVTADLVVVVTTGDESDVDGTTRMLRELYNLFSMKTVIVINKVLDYNSQATQEELDNRIKKIYQVPSLGIVPCFCDVLRSKGSFIFVERMPEHPFSKLLNEMTKKIDAY